MFHIRCLYSWTSLLIFLLSFNPLPWGRMFVRMILFMSTFSSVKLLIVLCTSFFVSLISANKVNEYMSFRCLLLTHGAFSKGSYGCCIVQQPERCVFHYVAILCLHQFFKGFSLYYCITVQMFHCSCLCLI